MDSLLCGTWEILEQTLQAPNPKTLINLSESRKP